MGGCAPFFKFCKFQVNWGNNMHTFYQLGKKYAFSPPFFILQLFFSPNMIFGHIFFFFGGGGQTERYTPLLKGAPISPLPGLIMMHQTECHISQNRNLLNNVFFLQTIGYSRGGMDLDNLILNHPSLGPKM